jgi:hypothetical protein
MTQTLTLIQQLLAQAEDPSVTEPEAMAFLAKAQALMIRHGIDEAILRAEGHAADEKPINKKLVVSAPYATKKSYLLHVIADAHGCTMCQSGQASDLTAHLVGYASDIRSVETLFATLLIVGQRELIHARATGGYEAHYHVKAFAGSFWLGFAARVGYRLDKVSGRVESEAQEQTTGSVALAIMDRSAQVKDAAERAWGPVKLKTAPSASSWEGALAGHIAANRANLAKDLYGHNEQRTLA